MNKLLVLFAFLSVAGCKTVIPFPTFYSHQDLREQMRELENNFKKKEPHNGEKQTSLFIKR